MDFYFFDYLDGNIAIQASRKWPGILHSNCQFLNNLSKLFTRII